ncbi:twin-arginine translocase TatA/TatE family subunit [Neogemmobacter tilapiae]|uniref:Sec-independent protein translocase protein TatA n=1 Tax=Neogemmobacter tilapiae TaxID=875041 RepID=A0A918TNC3_9RHOB|nr:Sec-independent protein translocase protein TatA [Gemmobacter tilapiae]
MHPMGPTQLLLIAAVVLVLFGRGKVSSMMGEVGKGISAFKKGIKEGGEETRTPEQPATLAIEKEKV